MNVLRFELRQVFNMTLGWWVGLAVLLAVYVSVYPAFSSDAETMRQLFDAMPAAVHAALGLNLEGLSSFLGFLGNVFTVVLLASSIQGVSLALVIFGREGRSLTTDFLLTKPVARSSIFCSKFLAGLIVVILTTLWIGLMLMIFSQPVSAEPIDMTKLWMIVAVFGFVQIWFFMAGLLKTQITKRTKSVAPASLVISFGFFLLGVIGTIIDKEAVRWVVPSKYIDLTRVVESGNYEWQYVAVGILVAMLMAGVSYVIYTRKDVDNQT